MPQGIDRDEVQRLLSEGAQLWGEAWHEVRVAVQRYGCYHDPDDIRWSTDDVRDLVALKGWEYLCTTTDPARAGLPTPG